MKVTPVMLAASLVVSLSAQTSLYDDFEGATLNPFWSTRAQSGSITFPSTTRVHAGRQAVRFSSTNTSSDKYIWLSHAFARPTYGCVSVWVYDTGADRSSSNSLALLLYDGNGVPFAYVIGSDYDLGSQNGGNYQFVVNNVAYNSGIDRTQAWHHFAITSTPMATRIAIDGLTVHQGPPTQAFSDVTIAMYAPSWRPAWDSDWDDFAFVPFTPGTYTLFGAGCPGSAGTPTINAPAVTPAIGSDFDVTVTQLPLTSAAFGVLGTSNTRLGNGTPLPLDLTPIGMPTCRMLVSNDYIEFLGNRPTPPTARWRISVPNFAGLIGATFHQQVWVTDPGVNSIGIVTTNAGTGTIGSCP